MITNNRSFRVTPQELERINQKRSELGMQNMGAYLRKMAMDGYCVKLELGEVARTSSLLGRCSNNLNQYAKRANETGSIYAEDIHDLQTQFAEIRDLQRKIVKKLSAL